MVNLDWFVRKTTSKDYDADRLVVSTKTSVVSLNRPHTSISAIEGKYSELDRNKVVLLKYAIDGNRYVLCKEITFDMLITVYDANTSSLLAIRPTSTILDTVDMKSLQNYGKKFVNANIEIRAIGLQNQGGAATKIVEQVASMFKGSIIELDLFGNQKRHVCIDVKTGASYDVLLLNRIYKPTELANDMTAEQFKSFIGALEK